MGIGAQVCVILLGYFWGFLYMRLFLGAVINHQLNTSAQRKRKKGQSIKEWFLYSGFRDVLPRLAVIWYLIIVAIHPIALTAYIILTLAGVPQAIWKWVFLSPFLFDLVWMAVVKIMFWQLEPGFKIDRWIKKKRGMKK